MAFNIDTTCNNNKGFNKEIRIDLTLSDKLIIEIIWINLSGLCLQRTTKRLGLYLTMNTRMTSSDSLITCS